MRLPMPKRYALCVFYDPWRDTEVHAKSIENAQRHQKVMSESGQEALKDMHMKQLGGEERSR